MAEFTELIRGDTLEVNFSFLNGETNLPENITGWLLYWTFKIDPAIADNHATTVQSIVDLSVADPLNMKYKNLQALNGKVTLRLSPELTKKFTIGRMFWDIQRVTPIFDSGLILRDHNVETWAKSTVQVVIDVTKDYLTAPIVP